MAPDQLTVLLVEHNEDSSALVVEFLRHSGIRVIAASTGEDALALARSEKPGVIITRSWMPGMAEGWEIVTLLRAAVSPRQVSIVGLTSEEVTQVEREAMNAGCSLVMPLPLDLRRLVTVISERAASQATGT